MSSNVIAIIPETSPIHEQFADLSRNARIVIFSGLPGVGKSLYIREFCRIADSFGKKVDLIQWDVARKSFETDYIQSHYPMGDGTVHNGLKIIAGKWLMSYVKNWVRENAINDHILLIEAPLVGNRFSELVHKSDDIEIESYLSSDKTRVVVPIPTRRVRKMIEDERARQVSEDAKVWSGAKPSVMLMLWKDTCSIANNFGMDIDLSGQPEYNPGVYEFVYGRILKNRHFEPLIIDEVFDVPPMGEDFLHAEDSIKATASEADDIAKEVIDHLSISEIDDIVSAWYKT